MMDPSQVRSELKKLLKREPTVTKLKDGGYVADYFEYKAHAKEFKGATEDEAYRCLFEYLSRPKT
jgi:hypothetical protein